MKRILFIHSSLFGDDSASTQIATSLVQRLLRKHPGSQVTRIDLSSEALPHLDAEEFGSWSIPRERRSETQGMLAARSDGLIAQLMSHDTLVLAVPMYNLGVPSSLKAWIDRVSRAGQTFRYTSDGPQGLVEGVHAYLVLSRGGMYRGTPLDTQTSYLESVLGLMGITRVDSIFAEGLARGGGLREESIEGALEQAMKLTQSAQPENHHAVA